MAARKSGPLDAMVGAKIRMFRTNLGMSQTALAERIGVSFQQVQKYEKGANRVGASRLSQIASVLGISVGDLFESPQQKTADSNSPVHLLAEPGALRVLKAYLRTNSRVRLAIAKLVESIADHRPNAAKVGEQVFDVQVFDASFGDQPNQAFDDQGLGRAARRGQARRTQKLARADLGSQQRCLRQITTAPRISSPSGGWRESGFARAALSRE